MRCSSSLRQYIYIETNACPPPRPPPPLSVASCPFPSPSPVAVHDECHVPWHPAEPLLLPSPFLTLQTGRGRFRRHPPFFYNATVIHIPIAAPAVRSFSSAAHCEKAFRRRNSAREPPWTPGMSAQIGGGGRAESFSHEYPLLLLGRRSALLGSTPQPGGCILRCAGLLALHMLRLLVLLSRRRYSSRCECECAAAAVGTLLETHCCVPTLPRPFFFCSPRSTAVQQQCLA